MTRQQRRRGPGKPIPPHAEHDCEYYRSLGYSGPVAKPEGTGTMACVDCGQITLVSPVDKTQWAIMCLQMQLRRRDRRKGR